MSFLKNMELPEWTIIGSLLALPFVGWWISTEQSAIDVARTAIRRNSNELELIGKLQGQVELVERNRRTTGATPQDPGTYFEMQLTESDANRVLKTDDYEIGKPNPRRGTVGSGRASQQVTDYDVDIQFQKKDNKTDFTMTRDFLFAVLFNCESGAREGSAPLPAIWKLQELSLVNPMADNAFKGGKKVPPQPIDDVWVVKKLKFSRREPRKKS